jgi:hypothetical protein
MLRMIRQVNEIQFTCWTLIIFVQNTSEKCILVSHYTSTLNILEAYCKSHLIRIIALMGKVVVLSIFQAHFQRLNPSVKPLRTRDRNMSTHSIEKASKTVVGLLHLSWATFKDTFLVVIFLLSSKAGKFKVPFIIGK